MNVFKCLTLCSLLLFAGCLSEKKASSIKNNAINEWAKNNPCSVDSVIILGGSDTALVYDTVYVESIPTPNVRTELSDSVWQSWQQANIEYTPAGIKLDTHIKFIPQRVYITKTQTIHDTVRITKRDLRFEQMYKDSLQSSQFANQELKVSNAQVSAQASKWKLIFWCENILLLIVIIVLIYIHFRYGFLKGIM